MWAGFVAIVINAYIGTGLSMALLVFYRSRCHQGRRHGPILGAQFRMTGYGHPSLAEW